VKSLLIPTLALTVALGLVARAWADEESGAPKAADQTESAISLFPEAEDPPETTRFKAALRLMAGFNHVLAITQSCHRKDVWQNYQNRNGRTFSQVYGSLKSGGAFDRKYRDLVEGHAKALVGDTLARGCDAAMRDVERGDWDLYKAPRFKYDYNLFLGR
jgi:hypothetical protein